MHRPSRWSLAHLTAFWAFWLLSILGITWIAIDAWYRREFSRHGVDLSTDGTYFILAPWSNAMVVLWLSVWIMIWIGPPLVATVVLLRSRRARAGL